MYISVCSMITSVSRASCIFDTAQIGHPHDGLHSNPHFPQYTPL